MSPGVDLARFFHPGWSSLAVSIFLVVALVALVAAPSAARELAAAPWPRRRRDVTVGLVALAASFALRWRLAVHTTVHENHHGYHHVAWPSAVNEGASSHGVPSAHLLLAHLAGSLAGVSDAVTFAFDCALSSLAVVALGAYTAMVTRSRHAGLAAGVLLAMQPVSIALATTDEFLVSATGLCLAGMALLHAGARFDLRATLTLGAALACLGAGAREVTLPLSALAVPALLSSRTRDDRVPWRAAVAVCAALALALAPQAAAVISSWRAQPATPGYFGSPALPFTLAADHAGRDAHWVGWLEPYVPRWEGWSMVLALALVAAWCAARRDGRLALGVLAPALIALAQGGLVRRGWFPTHLRHQLGAMALALLPVGCLVGLAARRLSPRAASALVVAVALAAAASLARRPAGYAFEHPISQEYRFFRGALAAAPRDGAVVTLAVETVPHLPPTWLAVQRPAWRPVEAHAIGALASERGPPLFLLLDRACFLDLWRFAPRELTDAARSELTVGVATPFGAMRSHCAQALAALPWRVVASRTIVDAPTPTLEMPSLGGRARVALLRWDHP